MTAPRLTDRFRAPAAAILAMGLASCAGTPAPGPTPAPAVPARPAAPPGPPALPALRSLEDFREYGRIEARVLWEAGRGKLHRDSAGTIEFQGQDQLQNLAAQRTDEARHEFFKGRYNRSRARLPENIDAWRSRPDIANPGPDLANFPNSAFTLPAGRAYVEISPFTLYGGSEGTPAQYNAEFLLRYGATDDVELRLFGNGVSWQGGSQPVWGFAPIAFDAKFQLWTEKPAWYLPAAGLEAYVQTEWLSTSPAFNGGTQPSVTLNFDQSLPLDIDFEYNLGATRVRDFSGANDWEFGFQWAFQRDLFSQDLAVFVHGFYNAMNLPRLPAAPLQAAVGTSNPRQNAVGGGFIWTPNRRFALYGQCSGGTTRFTPSLISMVGFAVSF